MLSIIILLSSVIIVGYYKNSTTDRGNAEKEAYQKFKKDRSNYHVNYQNIKELKHYLLRWENKRRHNMAEKGKFDIEKKYKIHETNYPAAIRKLWSTKKWSDKKR